MTIDEMKNIEWVVPWSGGKDSTATIILMHQHNIPIKLIYHTILMYDENTPATPEIMNRFRNHAATIFREWGYKVEFIKSKKTAVDIIESKYIRSRREGFNGKKYGVSAFLRRGCCMQTCKVENIYNNDYQMIGYAIDEPERLNRMKSKYQSILAACNFTEEDAKKLCMDYGLLSPYYTLGLKRDGCFFCPNCSVKQRTYLREQEPDLYKKAISIVENTDPFILKCLEGLKANGYNHWLEEYDKYKEGKK